METIRAVFEPKSVAVIGASPREETVGNAIFSNILQSGFQGAVYPVNPKYNQIKSVKAYSNVVEVPESIDLAVICVPVSAIEKTIIQCAEKGVKGLVIITAGFKEIGEAGKIQEEKMKSLALKNNISIIGPNCLGIINTDNSIRLNANFAVGMPQSGNVALISQSGAIGIAALEYAHQHDLGISKFVSIGNKAVIDESDVLDYLIEDPLTEIITMYIEDIGRPSDFFKMAQKANSKEKPIIAIKTGRSVRGAIATHSHTGALSSSDTAYDSLFAQCGVIRVETLSELFEFAKGFTCRHKPKGNRIAIITNAGGMGVIATDAAEREGLELSTFEQVTQDSLKKVLPVTASIHNPVDIIGDADAKRFSDTFSLVISDKNVDSIIVSVTPTVKTDMDSIAKALSSISKLNPGKPILSNMMSLDPEPSFLPVLEDADIPNFDFPEINIRVLAAMIRYYQWIKQPIPEFINFEGDRRNVKNIFGFVKNENRSRLSEPEAYKVLQAYGLRVLDYRVAKDSEEAVLAAEQIGYPLVVKIISPDILHKVDVGGVKINITDVSQLKRTLSEISESVRKKAPSALIQGFLIQKYFTEQGIEIIAGANYIKGFGPLIMFGLGGTFVELFKDVAFRLAPLSKQDALQMISQTKGYQILKGFRGQTIYDIKAITEYLIKISLLLTDFPEIKELDLNPIKVLPESSGCVVMDAKMIL